MKTLFAVTVLAMLVAVPAFAAPQTWTIDPEHSNVAFKVKHMMVSNVKGDFGVFKGAIDIDEQDIGKSKVTVAVETASISTGVAKRDDHLRSADFLEVSRYPQMTFVSKRVKIEPDGRLKVYGDLTLHGVTREVVLSVEGPTRAYKDPRGNMRRGASATTTISRKDFGLLWNAAIESGGVVVGDEVAILLEVELIRK